MDKKYKLVIIDVPISVPKITTYEYASLISQRIKDVGEGSQPINISIEKMYTKVSEYDKESGDLIKDTVLIDGEHYVLEDRTVELVKKELNAGKCPLLILRELKRSEDTIYAEVFNPNDCISAI
jgi:hypothetical protein